MEGPLWTILRWVSIKDLRLEPCPHHVDLHEGEQPVFLQAQPICHNLDAFLQLVCLELLLTLSLNHVYIINGLLEFPLTFDRKAQGFVGS